MYQHLNELSLRDPAFISNPFPWYKRLREEAPVWFSEETRHWLISTYRDVSSGLRRGDVFGSFSIVDAIPPPVRPALAPTIESISRMVLFRNDPEHRAPRDFLEGFFGRKLVEDLRPHVESVVDYQINRVQERDEFDLIEDFTYPVAVMMIASVLGTPTADPEKFKNWTNWIKIFSSYVSDESEYLDSQKRYLESIEFFRDLIKTGQIRNDFIAGYLKGDHGPRALSDDDICSQLAAILFGGHDTVKNFLANGIYTLLAHPAELARLRADAELMTPAIEELIRFEGPAQIATRKILKDTEVSGQTLKAGDSVFLLLGSANRDPERFDEPDRFDIGRTPNPHLGFGLGLHRCVGTAVSKVCMEVVLDGVLRRMPKLRVLDERVEWNTTSISTRSMSGLRVTAK